MVSKSLFFTFFIFSSYKANDIFNPEKESSAGNGAYFYPPNDFAQYDDPVPFGSDNGKVSKRKSPKIISYAFWQ